MSSRRKPRRPAHLRDFDYASVLMTLDEATQFERGLDAAIFAAVKRAIVDLDIRRLVVEYGDPAKFAVFPGFERGVSPPTLRHDAETAAVCASLRAYAAEHADRLDTLSYVQLPQLEGVLLRRRIALKS